MDESDIPSVVAWTALSVFVVVFASRLYKDWREEKHTLKARVLRINGTVDVIYPLRGSMHALCHFDGRNLFLRRAELSPMVPTAHYKTINSIYDLPKLDGMFQRHDYIVLAGNGQTLRFKHDMKLHAWRSTQPITEIFV